MMMGVVMAVLLVTQALADNSIKEKGKEVGQFIKKSGKETGKEAKKAGQSTGGWFRVAGKKR
jgi:hypothetical protein